MTLPMASSSFKIIGIFPELLGVGGVQESGRQTARAMLEHKVAIGRSWEALPTHVRVTIGTAAEMEKFKAAFERAVPA